MCRIRAARPASPRRRAGRRPQPRCCEQRLDRARARATTAAWCRAAAGRCAPPLEARTPARPAAWWLTSRGADRDRQKWTTFLAWNWILKLRLLPRRLESQIETTRRQSDYRTDRPGQARVRRARAGILPRD